MNEEKLQRLIISFPAGDGYTFAYDQYLPVVFSSKEEFIITLEDVVKELHLKWIKHQEKYLKHADESQKIFSLDRSKPENLEKMKLHTNKHIELYNELKEIENFELGGQCLNLYDFLDVQTYKDSRGKDKTFRFMKPTVQTIDEYFEQVEKKENKKTIKP